MSLKKLIYGLLTVSKIRKLGYFIPYRYAGAFGKTSQPYPWIQKRFNEISRDSFLATLRILEPFIDDLKKIEFDSSGSEQPRWGQDWFPGLDAAVAYGLVRAKKPGTILEIGSGHSTRFLRRAITDHGLETVVTCIDPAPRASLKSLDLKLIKTPAQNVSPQFIPNLKKGDILLIDSSHLAIEGSDVDWVINRIIPALPEGVFIHFHDIFLPDPYPETWGWREYNEQLMVAALMAGGHLAPIFSSYFVRNYAPDLLNETNLDWIQLVPGAIESSLWFITN